MLSMHRKLGLPGLSGYLGQDGTAEENAQQRQQRRVSLIDISSPEDKDQEEEEKPRQGQRGSPQETLKRNFPRKRSSNGFGGRRRFSEVVGRGSNSSIQDDTEVIIPRRKSLSYINEALVEEDEDVDDEEALPEEHPPPPPQQQQHARHRHPLERQRSKSTIIGSAAGFGLKRPSVVSSGLAVEGSSRARSFSVDNHRVGRRASQIVVGEIFRMKEQFDDLVSILAGGGGDGGSKVDKNYNQFYNARSRINSGDIIYDHKTTRSAVQIFSVIGIAIGHILDGNVLAFTSPAIPSMVKGEGRSGIVFSEGDLSLIRSMFSIGATVACLFAGSAMSRLGRRGATLYVTLPAYVIGFLLIGSAVNANMVITGRFLTGVGLGMTLSVPTVYIVEITSPELRGGLAVIPNLFCQIGIFVTYVAGRFMDWSTLGLACASIGLPFLAAIWYIPESPTFLIKKGNYEIARKVLEKLDLDSSKRAIKSLEEKLLTEEFNKATVWTTWSNKRIVKPFISSVILMGFFQGTAFPLMMGNSLDIFRHMSPSTGGNKDSDHLANIVVGVVLILGSLLAIPLARNFERKTLLVVSAVGVSACLFLMATYFYLKQIGMADGLSWLPLAAFLIYIMFFMSGYGSVSWLVAAELLPTSVRSQAYPFAIAGTWTFNFVVQHSYAPMVSAMDMHGLLWFYSGLTALGVLFLATCLPETRGRSADEIAEFYEENRLDVSIEELP